MSNYDIEVKERWGETDAYKEHAEKTASYTKDKWQQVNDGLNAVLAKFAECMNSGHTADSDDAQTLVKELQTHIMAIFVPAGSDDDQTRKREWYDGIYGYLKEIGIAEI